jgi:DNA-binding response OmpR family regulator
MGKKAVIIAGWDNQFTENLCSILKGEKYELIPVPSLSEAKTRLEKGPFRVILIDLDQTALDNRFLRELRREYPILALVGLSSRRFHQELEEAMRNYIDACFEKSGDFEDLLYWLKAVFEQPAHPKGKKPLS